MKNTAFPLHNCNFGEVGSPQCCLPWLHDVSWEQCAEKGLIPYFESKDAAAAAAVTSSEPPGSACGSKGELKLSHLG